MLSHAASQTGLGWGFGLHEALDQTGAILGPLLVSGVLYLQGGYHLAFAILLIPAVVAFAIVVSARFPIPARRTSSSRRRRWNPLTCRGRFGSMPRPPRASRPVTPTSR